MRRWCWRRTSSWNGCFRAACSGALTEEEMEVYRRPYLEAGESRRPTLTWPREIPIDGEPADVVEIVSEYGEWLANSDVPKLLMIAELSLHPG